MKRFIGFAIVLFSALLGSSLTAQENKRSEPPHDLELNHDLAKTLVGEVEGGNMTSWSHNIGNSRPSFSQTGHRRFGCTLTPFSGKPVLLQGWKRQSLHRKASGVVKPKAQLSSGSSGVPRIPARRMPGSSGLHNQRWPSLSVADA